MDSKKLKLEDELDTVEDLQDQSQAVREDVSQLDTSNTDNADTSQNNNDGSSNSSTIVGPSSESARNPLQYPEIVQYLFQFCPLTTLDSRRLVSKLWHDESLLTWRATTPINIRMQQSAIFDLAEYLQNYSNRDPSHVPNPLTRFLDFHSNPENGCGSKPFRNITISNCQHSLYPEHFGIFWREIGKNLTTLSLSFCKFVTLDEFRQVIYKCCPILQELDIDSCTFPPQDGSGNVHGYQQPLFGEHEHLRSLKIRQMGGTQLTVSYLELFSHFPRLTSFGGTYFGRPGTAFSDLMAAIRILRDHNENYLRFRKFDFFPTLAISTPPSPAHRQFREAIELRLPLTRCSIQVQPRLDWRSLRRTLTFYAASFEDITLEKGGNENEFGIPTWFSQFPFGIQLNHLTTLCSHGDLIGNFNFLKYCPNLSKLEIFEGDPRRNRTQRFLSATKAVSDTRMVELTNVKMLRLTSFRLEFLVSNDEDLQHLINWMPNMTDVKMILSNKQLGMVCRNWKNLARLTVYGTMLTNEGVMSRIGNSGNEVGSRPNIANLEVLETLDLSSVQLTRKSVNDLFQHLPKLQELNYDRSLDGPVKRKDLESGCICQRAGYSNPV